MAILFGGYKMHRQVITKLCLMALLGLFIISTCSCKQEEIKCTSSYGRLQIDIQNLTSDGPYSIGIGIYPYSQFKKFDTSSNVFAFDHPNIIHDYKIFKHHPFELDSLKSGYYDISLQYSYIPNYSPRMGDALARGSYKTKAILRVRIACDSVSIIETTVSVYAEGRLIDPIEDGLPYQLESWEEKIKSIY